MALRAHLDEGQEHFPSLGVLVVATLEANAGRFQLLQLFRRVAVNVKVHVTSARLHFLGQL